MYFEYTSCIEFQKLKKKIIFISKKYKQKINNIFQMIVELKSIQSYIIHLLFINTIKYILIIYFLENYLSFSLLKIKNKLIYS